MELFSSASGAGTTFYTRVTDGTAVTSGYASPFIFYKTTTTESADAYSQNSTTQNISLIYEYTSGNWSSSGKTTLTTSTQTQRTYGEGTLTTIIINTIVPHTAVLPPYHSQVSQHEGTSTIGVYYVEEQDPGLMERGLECLAIFGTHSASRFFSDHSVFIGPTTTTSYTQSAQTTSWTPMPASLASGSSGCTWHRISTEASTTTVTRYGLRMVSGKKFPFYVVTSQTALSGQSLATVTTSTSFRTAESYGLLAGTSGDEEFMTWLNTQYVLSCENIVTIPATQGQTVSFFSPLQAHARPIQSHTISVSRLAQSTSTISIVFDYAFPGEASSSSSSSSTNYSSTRSISISSDIPPNGFVIKTPAMITTGFYPAFSTIPGASNLPVVWQGSAPAESNQGFLADSFHTGVYETGVFYCPLLNSSSTFAGIADSNIYDRVFFWAASHGYIHLLPASGSVIMGSHPDADSSLAPSARPSVTVSQATTTGSSQILVSQSLSHARTSGTDTLTTSAFSTYAFSLSGGGTGAMTRSPFFQGSMTWSNFASRTQTNTPETPENLFVGPVFSFSFPYAADAGSVFFTSPGAPQGYNLRNRPLRDTSGGVLFPATMTTYSHPVNYEPQRQIMDTSFSVTNINAVFVAAEESLPAYQEICLSAGFIGRIV